MQGQELFGVVVRTIGLLAGIYGCWLLVYAFGKLTKTISESYTHPTKDYFLAAIMYLGIGAALLLGAKPFVDVVYR